MSAAATADILQFVPLLHGDEIRAPDARRFLNGLHVDSGIRAACRGLGYMSLELDADTREARFRDCVGLLLSWIVPQEPAEKPCIPLTPGFLTAKRHPFLPGLWKRHATLQRAEGSKRVTAVLVTKELAERIDALQNFWGLPQFAVVFNNS